MLLVDAIEAWGQQHRTEFDRARLEYLGSIWSTVRKSDASELDVDSMTKDDARVVMALFDKDERRRVSEILNSVRTWSLSQGPAPSDAEPVVPVEPVETVVRAESARSNDRSDRSGLPDADGYSPSRPATEYAKGDPGARSVRGIAPSDTRSDRGSPGGRRTAWRVLAVLSRR